ncbi:rhodanese-like domain-containing protein [Gilvimarinus japonicus]|uniref:Rhodanese-like domain-containing protein n=1 Tax=Gilvimarinus japonicus TaxID=1796469 RepID=A0ABV7HKK7_9GAMM
MEIIAFLNQEWMLVSMLAVLILIYGWRERIKNGQPVTTQQATVLINADTAIWLDVRETKEFDAGHMVDAINIPHGKVAERLNELEKHRDKTIIVVDKLGQHAGSTGRLLGGKSFDVRRLTGGISEWQNQGLPLVK